MDRHRQFDPARHCFAFEQDFIGGWRCIPLCVRRKLDLIGLKLKLNHWLALTPVQRQELVDWADDAAALALLRGHLRRCTAEMADGLAADCSQPGGGVQRSAGVSRRRRASRRPFSCSAGFTTDTAGATITAQALSSGCLEMGQA